MNKELIMPWWLNELNRDEDEPLHFSEEIPAIVASSDDELHFSEPVPEILGDTGTGLFISPEVNLPSKSEEDETFHISYCKKRIRK